MKAMKKAVANMKSKAATKIRNVVIWLFKDELENILSSEGVIDYDRIADRIRYANVADCIDPRDVADYIDSGDVANHIDSGDVADHIEADEIAECVDMDGLRHELEAYIDSELVEKIQGATLEISL